MKSISCPAYNSHIWEHRRTSIPADLDEVIITCMECGIEDLGNPDEFDIDYPWCPWCEEAIDSENGDY